MQEVQDPLIIQLILERSYLAIFIRTQLIRIINYVLFFSDDDFWEFHKYARTNQGYLMALECGNKLFIAVVEDVQKYQTFMTIARVIQLKKEGYIETVLTPQQPNYYTHGQQASINAAIQFFGSAANCGLGFYETTYPEKTNFIKINP